MAAEQPPSTGTETDDTAPARGRAFARLVGAAPWGYALAATALVVYASVAGDLPEPWWRVLVVTAGTVAVVVSLAVRRMPACFAAAALLVSAHLALLPTGRATSTGPSAWLPSLLDAATGLALCVILVVIMRQRFGPATRHDVVDGFAILIGSSIVTWTVFTNPLSGDHPMSTAAAVVHTADIPIGLLLLMLVAHLAFADAVDHRVIVHNRTMTFVVAAAVANVAASVISGLELVGRLDGHPIDTTLRAAAVMLLCAGIVHRDAPDAVRPATGMAEQRHNATARVVTMTIGLIAPVGALAVVARTSRLDDVVRAGGTVLLMATLALRLSMAVRDQAITRDTLLHRISRDELTGLPTRSRFVEYVSAQLEVTWRSERCPTIIQLNLDRFKNINDSLGHFDANRVLVAVAQRLSTTAETFGGFVARAGGDDFVVVDCSTATSDDARHHVEMIRQALAQPITIDESTVFVTASIGVATTPRNRTISSEELMRRADIATHRAKHDGRNRTAFFDDSMQAHLAQRMDIEHALHGAIGRQEMRLYHQPIVDIVTGRVSGFETLMRWQRTDGSLVPPGDFIPVAEETGIICELGAWALNDALRELRLWIDSGIVPPTTTMSVNVSPRQIADPDFADTVREALDRSGISPHLLWLEMTESMMLEEPERAELTLHQIRSMGVRLALDDFGTGFSSLSLLQQFPIHRIKIDRAFVQGIAEHGNDRSLVRTIIAMAQSMGLDLVAEGVETVHQLRTLRDLGCDKAQGYLISRPVPPDAIRSTMIALDELQSLSLFGPSDRVDAFHSPEPLPVGQPAAPAFRPTAHPIGGLGSRPISLPYR